MPKTSPKTSPKTTAKAETKPAAATAAAKPVAARAAGKGDHVFLVDGSGYIFRAYHALPPMNRKSDGLQVNAVLGFCNMLWKLLREMPEDNRPTHLAIIFDKSEITFRNKIYPEYKAHRQPAPDDLIPQFALIREAVRAFDLPCLEQVGFEADDLIATYVRQACERGASATIVSSDKDLMQLVTDCVTMYDTMKDRRIGIPEVIEKFGVPPEKVVEVQALAGNSTDNVPGVPGIGIKTAAQLIVEYGDLEQLLFRATEIKQPKRREALIENAEKARISRQLVLLDDKVDLEVPLDDLAVHEPDARKLIAFLKAMEFSTLTRRVAEFSQIDPANVDADPGYSSGASVFSPLPPSDVVPAPGAGAPAQAPAGQRNASASKEDKAASPKGAPISLAAAREEALRKLPVDRSKYQAVKTLTELNAFIARIHDAGHVAVEIRANSIDPMQADLCGIALALAPNEACYVPLAHKQSGGGAGLFDAGLAPDQVKHADAIEALRPVLESPGILKIGFDVKFTAVMLAQHGITLRNTDDAQLISYVLDAGRGSHAIEQLSERWFGHAMLKESELLGSGKGKITFDQVPIDKAAALSAEGADMTLRVWRVLKPRLVAEHMTTVYETLERPLVSVLARMERRGISIDRQVLSRLSGDFAQTAARVEAEIQQIAGEPVNVGSPKQIGDILFGKMGLSGGTKTKTGAWSTTAQVLDELAEQGHDLPKKILEWRQVSKLKSTYTDALPTYVNAQTHRVHTTYALAATTTGRLSSNEPNLQNIPVRTEDGTKDPARLHRDARAQAGLRRLFADRAAAARRDRRHSRAAAGVPRRSRHSRHDGIGNVRRADQGHAERNPAPRQGDQFRHHLRHFGIRPRQPARHRARGSLRLHQEVLRALPRHPRLHGRDARLLPEPRLRHHAVRTEDVLSRHQGFERLGARLQRARRDQRPAPGHRRRHHPPRHDADGGCPGPEETVCADAAAGA